MRLWWSVPVCIVLAAPAVAMDEGHQHGTERLGKVDFPVSCKPDANAKFQRALALLHSFAYEEAEKAFKEVAAADPACAMAHWGVAMSLFHPIWAAANPAAAPGPEELQRGWEAVQTAKSLAAGSEREKDYIAAVEAFFAEPAGRDYAARALAFESGMERVHARHPTDKEAAIFFSLALLGNAPPSDKTYGRQKKAAALLNGVLPGAPEHPGVAHYIIHSFDYPALAELALPAARAYSRIAPSAPHALHMPSHIFTRLALWDESIRSNLDSAAAARRWRARDHPEATHAFDELHALDYLEYAYLQTCRDREADDITDRIRRVERLDVPQFAAAYALAAVPARHALEQRDWAEAQALSLTPASFPWPKFRNTEAIVEFARAVGAARAGKLEVARAAVERLAVIQKALAQAGNAYWAEQVEIQRRAAQAWVAQAEGRGEEAVALLRSASDLEDASEKHPVTPGQVLPAREQLGDLLLELGRAAEALAEYETSLRFAPGRYNTLLGAFRAATKAAERVKARQHASALSKLCEKSDGSRPGLSEARAALRASH